MTLMWEAEQRLNDLAIAVTALLEVLTSFDGCSADLLASLDRQRREALEYVMTREQP